MVTVNKENIGQIQSSQGLFADVLLCDDAIRAAGVNSEKKLGAGLFELMRLRKQYSAEFLEATCWREVLDGVRSIEFNECDFLSMREQGELWDVVAECRNVEEISFRDCPFSIAPNTLPKGLKRFILTGATLLPEDQPNFWKAIAPLTQLEHLELWHCGLEVVPATLPLSIKFLDLGWNRVLATDESALWAVINSLPLLEDLTVANIRFRVYPDVLPATLKRLNMRGCRFTAGAMPTLFKLWTNLSVLQQLDVRTQRVFCMPEAVVRLRAARPLLEILSD